MDILLLEDDRVLCASLKEYLESEGYRVDAVYRGTDVFERTFVKQYDLYILDVNVPGENGFDVLKALKEAGDETPAIYITALTDIASIHQGFRIGAEDYLKKPFDPEELVIRIKSKYEKRLSTVEIQGLKYDPVRKTIEKEGKIIPLGEVQTALFHRLVTQKNRIVESYELMELLEQPNPNALRVNIAKIKSKLGIEITNVRGRGYMIEEL